MVEELGENPNSHAETIKNPSDDMTGDLSRFLVPNGLKKFNQEFLDIEDIFEIGKKKPNIKKNPFPKSPSKSKPPSRTTPKKKKSQKKLEEKIENAEIEMKAKNELDELEPQTEDPSISDKERNKSLNCMMNILQHQLKTAQEEVMELTNDVKRTDADCNKLEEELQRDENQAQIDEIKRRKDLLEREINEAMEEAEEKKKARDPFIGEIIVQNQMLLDQCDYNGVGKEKKLETEESILFDDNISIDTEEINNLYEEARTEEPVTRRANEITKRGKKSKSKTRKKSITKKEWRKTQGNAYI